jgi:hypothetical protein
VNDEVERYLEGSCRGLFKAQSRNSHGGLRKTTKNLSQDRWSPGRVLNQGVIEYEAGMFTTQP